MANGKSKRDALLLIGQLRCWDENSATLKRLAQKFDVFIVTDTNYQDCVNGFAADVFYVDFDLHERTRHEELDAIFPPEGRKMLQWSKLACGMRQIEAAEAMRGQKYQRVLKLRSDIANMESINFYQHFEPNCFYCYSDYVFGALRDDFFLLVTFCKNPEIYLDWSSPIDTSLPGFKNSNYKAARFKWLPYPDISLFRNLPFTIVKHLLRFRVKFDALRSMSYRGKEGGWRSIRFASEVYFLRYILEQGMTVKSISYNSNKIRLIQDRKDSI
ncbi:hypothetical protein [Lentibacter sp.]|jgi:hypothetical protein|uniref:hypothetical protein n=1 Tax=Lentibacter sp. TaxID=2024994 RepID=UPI0032D8ED17